MLTLKSPTMAPANRPTPDSHLVSNIVKSLRRNSQSFLHKLLRKMSPCLGPRISACLMHHPLSSCASLISIIMFFAFISIFNLSFFIFTDTIITTTTIATEQTIPNQKPAVRFIQSLPEAPEVVPVITALTPLRLIIIVSPFNISSSSTSSSNPTTIEYDENRFHDLMSSLHETDYFGQPIDITIILLPHEDHEIFHHTYKTAASTKWIHGRVTITNATTGGHMEHVTTAWNPARGSPESVILIEARRANRLSPTWYRFITSVRKRYSHRADIIAVCIEPTKPRGSEPPSIQTDEDPDVFLWEGAIGAEETGILMPMSVDKWRSFQRWFQQQRSNWFLWPSVIGLRDKRDERWAHFQSTTHASWSLWLSRFSAIHGVYTLYPKHIHPIELPITKVRDVDIDNNSNDDGTVMMKNSRILRLALDTSIIKHGAESRIEDESVHKIVQLGRKYGGAVSLTVINSAFLDTARSWICNVAVGGFRPPGIVWIVTDDEAYEGLKDVAGSYALRVSEMKGAKRGTTFGTPGYWLLMLERTMLIRDILNHGIGVFAFETDQVWLRNPIPYVERLVRRAGDDVDIVGTIDSSFDIAGNFLYLNPTLATRKVWDEVSKRFEYTYRTKKIDDEPGTARIIIDNDQTLLSKLVLYEEPFRSKYPVVFRTLDTELFVSGRWYDGGKRFYTSMKSRSPIMINNNFIEGIHRKTLRLKKHAHWFLKPPSKTTCNASQVRNAIQQNEFRADKAGFGGRPAAAGVPRVIVGVDKEASIDLAVDALNWEREDEETLLLDLRPVEEIKTVERTVDSFMSRQSRHLRNIFSLTPPIYSSATQSLTALTSSSSSHSSQSSSSIPSSKRQSQSNNHHQHGLKRRHSHSR